MTIDLFASSVSTTLWVNASLSTSIFPTSSITMTSAASRASESDRVPRPSSAEMLTPYRPDRTRGFRPSWADPRLLRPFAGPDGPGWFLEIGCGNGEIALEAAGSGARVVATDLNPHALAYVAARSVRDRRSLSLVRTDLASGLGRFDRILSNPPYLPTRPGDRDRDRWHDLAVNGGPDGLAVARRIVGTLGEHLSSHGSAFIVFS